MDDRKGKSSIFDCILWDLWDDEFRCRDDDLRNLIFSYAKDDFPGFSDDDLRRIVYTRFRLKKADDMNSALLSAKKKAGRDKRHVVIPPGSKLLTIAEFFYSKKTYTLRFKPIVADMQQEYFEALYEKRVWKARWMYGLYVWKFFCAMGLSWGFSLLEKILKTWKASS